MRKPRPDSTIHNLPEELRQAVDDALAANATLKDVQAILAEGGVRLSLQSISEYYKLHLLPRIWAAEDHNAAQLAKIKRGNVTKATHAAVLQTCYEVITRRQKIRRGFATPLRHGAGRTKGPNGSPAAETGH